MPKKKPGEKPKDMFVLVDDQGAPLDQHFGDAGEAEDSIEDEMVEENCGPVRVFRYAAVEEVPRKKRRGQ